MGRKETQGADKELVGLTMRGELLRGEVLKQYGEVVVAVAQGRKALGTEIETDLCAINCLRLPRQTMHEEIDIVIGDSWLIEGVIIVERECLRDLAIPPNVRKILSCIGRYNGFKFIIFKNGNGDLIWVQDYHATLRRNFESRLGRKLSLLDLSTRIE